MGYKEHKRMPIMRVGKYSGVPVDKLPNSYLRWLVGQDFSKEIVEAAKEKLAQSDFNDVFMNVTRHATDMFSKRFLNMWIQDRLEEEGIATFITRYAQLAWEQGMDVSKHRHQNDGIIKEFKCILWVFNVSPNFPDYKDLITVMPGEEQ